MKLPAVVGALKAAVSRSGMAAGSGGDAVLGDGSNKLRAVAGYMRQNMTPYFLNWFPTLRDVGEDVRESWALAAGRATDLIHNSGYIAGGIESSCGSVLGTGLRLTAQPDTTLIKFDGLVDDAGEAIDAEGWARFVERRFEAYASDPNECDARGTQTLAMMARGLYKGWFRTGEMLATLPHVPDAGSISSTKVLVIPPHRLSQRSDSLNRIFQGVRLDTWGRPLGYFVRSKNRLGIEVETEILARDGAGRPQVVHLFEGDSTQVRGITPLVACLHVSKQFDLLHNAQTTAALIQTIFAATIESESPTSDVLQGLQSLDEKGVGGGSIADLLGAMMGWHDAAGLDLGQHGKVAHLFPGEKLKFNKSEHPNTNYEKFARFLLLEIAKACGSTYEELTGDYTGVTYTGVRMSRSDTWQIVMHRRRNLIGRFYQMVYAAWLEEEVETGRVKFPGGLPNFIRLRSAATRATFRGPPKPQADDLKTAKAHAVYRELGVMTDGQIANEIGDMEIGDVYAARSREAKQRKKYGLPDTGPSTQLAVAAASGDNDDDETEGQEAA